jgi:hypothetical protein
MTISPPKPSVVHYSKSDMMRLYRHWIFFFVQEREPAVCRRRVRDSERIQPRSHRVSRARCLDEQNPLDLRAKQWTWTPQADPTGPPRCNRCWRPILDPETHMTLRPCGRDASVGKILVNRYVVHGGRLGSSRLPPFAVGARSRRRTPQLRGYRRDAATKRRAHHSQATRTNSIGRYMDTTARALAFPDRHRHPPGLGAYGWVRVSATMRPAVGLVR